MINQQSHNNHQKIAVIDIGSNSVRLVVYDGLKRTPLPLFNEKVLCGLGRGLDSDGKLNAAGVESAERAIARFVTLAENMKVGKITALATAAVREAKDGGDFTRRIKEKYGLTVKIISGEEEAKFSCLGVLESIFNAKGVVGDLGGGSLELSYINSSGQHGGYQSFPLGPLRLKRQGKRDYKAEAEIIDGHLVSWPHLKAGSGQDFYAVGGGFRALAKIHMARRKYPLKVLHNYIVPAGEMAETLDEILKTPGTAPKQFPFISASRLETLGFTALITSRIIKLLSPASLVFSVHGIREGYLFSLLDEKTRAQNPLIAGCTGMIENVSPEPKGAWTKFGEELFAWMSPLFLGEKPQAAKLRLAACLLSRIAWYEHTEYRAEMAFRLILDASLSGVTHEDRIFIATAVYHRYKTSFENSSLLRPLTLIERKAIAEARNIGLAARLGLDLSAGAPGILHQAVLSIEKNRLYITFPAKTAGLMGEPVTKRFFKLAEALDLKPEVRVER